MHSTKLSVSFSTSNPFDCSTSFLVLKVRSFLEAIIHVNKENPKLPIGKVISPAILSSHRFELTRTSSGLNVEGSTGPTPPPPRMVIENVAPDNLVRFGKVMK